MTANVLPGVKTGSLVALKTDVPEGPLDNRRSYYLAAQTSAGIAVWAIDDDALNGRSGLVFAADEAARKVSNLGDLIDVSEFGIGPGDPDYDAVKACL